MVDPAKKPEAKAIAAPVGGGLGGVLTVFTLWLIGVYVWDAPSDAAHATLAIAAVPLPVSGLITAVVPAAFALAAAYWAPHTHRPDLAGETLNETIARREHDHLDERIATKLEQIDATIDKLEGDYQARYHTEPVPEVGLRIMDEAHD